jgi:hypothetical protein
MLGSADKQASPEPFEWRKGAFATKISQIRRSWVSKCQPDDFAGWRWAMPPR